jgi:hypothetical protein
MAVCLGAYQFERTDDAKPSWCEREKFLRRLSSTLQLCTARFDSVLFALKRLTGHGCMIFSPLTLSGHVKQSPGRVVGGSATSRDAECGTAAADVRPRATGPPGPSVQLSLLECWRHLASYR